MQKKEERKKRREKGGEGNPKKCYIMFKWKLIYSIKIVQNFVKNKKKCALQEVKRNVLI